MNNDLISRDYVVDVYNRVKEACKNCDNYNGVRCRACDIGDELLDLKDIIDNAPTVPQDCSNCKRYDFPLFEIKFDKEQMQKLVDKAKAEVLASIEKPKGEWIFQKANEEQIDGYECSNCKACFHTKVPYFSEFNFCPNCGAEMKKGGAE